jgi:hypothetical protein
VELREIVGPGSPEIAILGGWYAVPPAFKALILRAQIEYAAEQGKLARAGRFLRALEPKEWFRNPGSTQPARG